MKQAAKSFVMPVSLFLLCLLFVAGCQNGEDRTSSDADGADIISRARYAKSMQFDFRMVVDEERFGRPVISDPLSMPELFGGPDYTDFVLVYSKEEALQFPDDVVTAWPSTRTLGVINGLNWVIQREDPSPNIVGITGDIDLSEFSLEFPITLSDVVENWENVRELNSALHIHTWLAIAEGAMERHAEAFSDELIQLAKERSEELPEANISQDDIRFANRFNFSFRMVVGDEVISIPVKILTYTQVFYQEFDSFYTDFVLPYKMGLEVKNCQIKRFPFKM